MMINLRGKNARKNGDDREKGYTLLEVIFSICIISIGLLGVASMQAGAIRGNHFADGVSIGSTWASDKLEKLMATAEDSYDDASLKDTDGDGDAGLDHATSATADYEETKGKYSIFWNISVDSLLSNTKTISVIVTWKNHGDDKSVIMRHIVAKSS